MPQQPSTEHSPWYSQWWSRFKQFPTALAAGSQAEPPETSGEVAAAFISAAISAVILMFSHHLADGDKTQTIDRKLLQLGSWIPGSQNPDPMWGNIGSYAGKETVLLLSWVASWLILYLCLKDKQVSARTIFFWLIGLMTLATAMTWHPLFPYLPIA
jgi:hypothetical protein